MRTNYLLLSIACTWLAAFWVASEPCSAQCLVPVATLTDPDANDSAHFGWSMDMGDDVLAIGAHLYDWPGDQGGAVYFFDPDNWTMTEESPLINPTEGLWTFGWSISLDGNRAVIGARGSSHPEYGENGAGAVAFVDRVGGTWQPVQTVFHPENNEGESFGCCVALSGSTALVGCMDHDLSLDNNGEVWVFNRAGGSWTHDWTPWHDDVPNSREYFGEALAIEGSTALVGVPGECYSPTFSGAVRVFEQSGGWHQIASLLPPEEVQHFGDSVALQGDTAIVGASPLALGAWVFERIDGQWKYTARLLGSDELSSSPTGDQGRYYFPGTAVAIDNDRVVVGNFMQDYAHVYERLSSGNWVNVGKVEHHQSGYSAKFGHSVAIHGRTIVVGAPCAHVGVNPTNSGAVYVYTMGAYLGDMNCDCALNFNDIDPFVLALTGEEVYHQQYPECDWMRADCNGDGEVNFDDLDPFMALLAG